VDQQATQRNQSDLLFFSNMYLRENSILFHFSFIRFVKNLLFT